MSSQLNVTKYDKCGTDVQTISSLLLLLLVLLLILLLLLLLFIFLLLLPLLLLLLLGPNSCFLLIMPTHFEL